MTIPEGAKPIAGTSDGPTCAGNACVRASCTEPSPIDRFIATGSQPNAIVIGDWNGDHFADLAVSNSLDDRVSILRGCGDGTFAEKVDYEAGNSPYALVACDLNGDRNADLVAANYGADTLTVLLGRADGTFVGKGSYAGRNSGGSRVVACSDLNGDGFPDVALIDFAGSAVSVLLGLGDGQLATRVDYPTANLPESVAIADVNHDDRPDVITGNSSDSNVSVLLGNGDGTLGQRIDHSEREAYGANSIALGDLNGDGHLDLGVGDLADRGPQGHFGVMPGNGDGTFGLLVDYPPQADACQILAGDFNADGRLDLLGLTYSTINTLFGQQGGGLLRGGAFTLRGAPCSLAASGDVNGDGILDIAVVAGSNDISVLLGAGDGSFP